LMIDCTTSLDNNTIRTQDNFVFTSFVEPMRVKPQTKSVKNKKNSVSSNKRIYNDVIMTVENDTNNGIIDEKFQQTAEKTPRPPNAFILYRRAKQPLITKERGNVSNAK